MSNSKKSIFFSYSRFDSEFTHKLAKDLQDKGYKIWIDQIGVEAGTRWDKEVEKALDNSEILLIVLSPDSVSSENVMDEFSFALEENKKIVPVLYKECKIPLRLRRLHYIDFTDDYSNSLNRLIDTINSDAPSEQNIDNFEKRVIKEKSSKKLYYYIVPILIIFLVFLGRGWIFPTNEGDNGNTNEAIGTSTSTNTAIIPFGKWTGELDLNIGGSYQTILNITEDHSTLKVIGSNDECVGDLELREQGSNSVTYRYIKKETLRGRCFPVGTVILNRFNNNSLQYLWYSDDQIAQVKGTLNKE